ncbi:hypothetical protein H4S02_005534 [Coemansia sp. RSA 2611]|nr:hypothetical protein IWW52_001271 [Coemansia sp. RSA 2704]KAJ2382901.1 hypothetical protein H4S02_005534 [Coemansia sp. RSA 2611]
MGEDEDKYFTAGTRPGARTLPPDSGTSVNYQDKAAEDKPGQKVASTSLSPPGKHGAGVTEHDSTANQALNMNYYGYRTYGMTETASSNTNERAAFATARSDIYDCISNGKRHNFAQSASRQEAVEAYPATPASRIAARRGAISFDHVKIQPLPSIPAHSKAGIDARTGYAGYECPRTEASVLSQHMLAPSPAEIDTKRALLDTTSANPGIKQTAGESDSLGIRIKPRKLTRDSVKRPNASSQGKGSRQLVDTKSQLAVARNPYQQATPENSQSIQDQPRLPGQVASKFNRQPLASPPHTPNLAEPSRQRREAANFLSLVDSVESLSESYQFAVRHKPPLGPLHVVEPHAPALPDELRVKRGDELFVVGEFADGWVLAVNVSRANECGMIPRRCLFFPTTPFMAQKSVMETITPPDVQSPAFSP